MKILMNPNLILKFFDFIFSTYSNEDENGDITLFFDGKQELEKFEVSVFEFIEKLSENIENVDGGNFIINNSMTCAHLFIFLRDDEGTIVCDKNFSICY